MASILILSFLTLFIGVVVHLGMDAPKEEDKKETVDEWCDRQW